MIRDVSLSRAAMKQLEKIPHFVRIKLKSWVEDVETIGLQEVRKVPGFHDEPLHGKRKVQRSIRLSRSYRAIYVIKQNGHIEFVSIEEVSKHDY
jgi:proteic killer suppression protein